LDTALSLLAYADAAKTPRIEALAFLKSTQRNLPNDKGWGVGYTGSSDAVTTALVVRALAKHRALDATLVGPITDGLNTLSVLVTLGAPTILQAIAAQAALDAGNTTLATTFLSRLINTQSGGYWTDPYDTALAIQALANAAHSSDQAATVQITDQTLRKAINQALGRSAMDGLNRGELAQLTSLSAVGLGINSLTGLEWAVNLTSADLRNNNITTAAPLTGLTQLTNLQLAGNPLTGNPLGIGSTSTKTVPAMPLFAQIFLLIGLSWVSLQPSRRQRS
jgi:hypothetical protein